MKCVVKNCSKSNEGKSSLCSFFRFPSNSIIRKKWIAFCGQKNFNANTSYVCMDHFKKEDFANNLQYEMGFALKRLLKDGTVPTINLANSQNNEIVEQRARRVERRENKKTVDFLLRNHNSTIMPPSNENCPLQSIKIENQESEGQIMEIACSDLDVPSLRVEQRAGRVDFLIQNHNSTIMPSNENCTLQSIKIENQQSEEQTMEVASSDVDALSLKVKSLEDEILILKDDKKNCESKLKIMKEEMDTMEKIYKYEKEKMMKRLAKAKSELACIEEKLEIIFTKGQIRKLKNGIKRQIWLEDDIAHSLTLYTASPKMYKLLYKNQFPLPAVRTLQSWVQKLKNDQRT